MSRFQPKTICLKLRCTNELGQGPRTISPSIQSEGDDDALWQTAAQIAHESRVAVKQHKKNSSDSRPTTAHAERGNILLSFKHAVDEFNKRKPKLPPQTFDLTHESRLGRCAPPPSRRASSRPATAPAQPSRPAAAKSIDMTDGRALSTSVKSPKKVVAEQREAQEGNRQYRHGKKPSHWVRPWRTKGRLLRKTKKNRKKTQHADKTDSSAVPVTQAKQLGRGSAREAVRVVLKDRVQHASPLTIPSEKDKTRSNVPARSRDWSRAFTVDGKPYWFDVDTDETTWVRPDGYLTEEDQDDSDGESPAQNEVQASTSAAVASHNDVDNVPPTSGATNCSTTGTASKDTSAQPLEEETPRLSETESNNAPPPSQSSTVATSQAEEPSHDATETDRVDVAAGESQESVQKAQVEAQLSKKRPWSRTFAADGRPYWFDLDTDETTWERPDGYLTEEDRDSDDGGSGANSPDAQAAKGTLDGSSEETHDKDASRQPSSESSAAESANDSHVGPNAPAETKSTETHTQRWSRTFAPDGRPYWFDVETDETTWERPGGYHTEGEEMDGENEASSPDAQATKGTLAGSAEETHAQDASRQPSSECNATESANDSHVGPSAPAETKSTETHTQRWSRTFAPDGRPYWFDVETDETTWERPDGYRTEGEEMDGEIDASGTDPTIDASPDVGEGERDNDSSTAGNGASQPGDDAGHATPRDTARVWSRTFTEDGRPYWFDVNTEETTWDRPEEYHTDDDQQEDDNIREQSVQDSREQTTNATASAVPVSLSMWSSAMNNAGQRYYFHKEVRSAT